jgi:hypothetical protein
MPRIPTLGNARERLGKGAGSREGRGKQAKESMFQITRGSLYRFYGRSFSPRGYTHITFSLLRTNVMSQWDLVVCDR